VWLIPYLQVAALRAAHSRFDRSGLIGLSELVVPRNKLGTYPGSISAPTSSTMRLLSAIEARRYRGAFRRRVGLGGGSGRGPQPAMIMAHSRALALSVIPGNNRRSSMAAENSPPCSKAARIAAASDSETTNIR
jgi:hypothetical protein